MLQEVRFQVLLLASYALRREGGGREEGGRIAMYIPKTLLTESNCIIF